MPLRVALDATLWDEPTTGIGLVTRALHEALLREGVQVLRVGARSSGEFPRGRRSRTGYLLEGLPALLRREHFDVFHALSNFNLPLQRVVGTRLVLTVHDLIPLRAPDNVSAAFRWQFRLWLSRSVVVADRVLAVSAHTRDQLRARFPGVEATVVPNGVDHVDAVPAPDRISQQWIDAQHLPPGFILYAGALEARKNVGLVLEACLRLQARGARPTLVRRARRGSTCARWATSPTRSSTR
jgi:glycosyltransferase involved in cell wall biosynthesis